MSLGGFLLVAFVWTGLVALGAELFTRGDQRPHFSQAVWRGAAALMILPWLTAGAAYLWPSAVADLPIPDVPDMDFVGLPMLEETVGRDGSVTYPLTAGMALAGILVGGWLLRLVCALRAQARLQRLKSSARPVEGSVIVDSAEACAAQLGMNGAPSVSAIEDLASPFAAGIGARTIYLPRHLLDSGHEPMIIAHESVHIARGDLIARPFERLIADIIWFSPFAWYARRRLDYLREAVCDAETIQLTGARKAYARALVDVARSQSVPDALPVAAFILKDRTTLKRRVSSLLGEAAPHRKWSAPAAILAACLSVPLAVAQGISAPDGVSSLYTHTVITSDDAKITSKWGKRPHPTTGKLHFHKGIDVAAPKGTPIYTPANATVKYCGTKEGYGNVVDVLLEDGTKLRFTQMKKSSVEKGQQLTAGDLIGYVGQSGEGATGPHLHLEVWRKGEDGKAKSLDPELEGISLIN